MFGETKTIFQHARSDDEILNDAKSEMFKNPKRRFTVTPTRTLYVKWSDCQEFSEAMNEYSRCEKGNKLVEICPHAVSMDENKSIICGVQKVIYFK